MMSGSLLPKELWNRSGRSEPFADDFFDKEAKEAVGFEIALAALLATALLEFRIEGHELIGGVLAFSLLFLTLVRRVLTGSPYARESTLDRTVVPLEAVTTLSITYLSIQLLTSLLGSRPSIPIFAVAVLLVSATTLVLQEYLVRDYAVWWYAKMKQRSDEFEGDDNVFAWVAMLAYRFSLARRSRESRNAFTSRNPVDLPDLEDLKQALEENLSERISRMVKIIAILYVIPVILFVPFSNLWAILIGLPLMAIHDQSCFWYIAYGNVDYEELRRSVPRLLLWTGAYAFAALFLLDAITMPHVPQLPL